MTKVTLHDWTNTNDHLFVLGGKNITGKQKFTSGRLIKMGQKRSKQGLQIFAKAQKIKTKQNLLVCIPKVPKKQQTNRWWRRSLSRNLCSSTLNQQRIPHLKTLHFNKQQILKSKHFCNKKIWAAIQLKSKSLQRFNDWRRNALSSYLNLSSTKLSTKISLLACADFFTLKRPAPLLSLSPLPSPSSPSPCGEV